MAYFRCGGGGVPASVKTDMNAVLNKKFGTSTDYPPADWAPTVNLMGPLPEKTASSAPICTFSDGADDVPTKSLVVTIPPTLSGVSSVTETQTGKNIYKTKATTRTNNGVTYTVNNDGTISLGGEANSTSYLSGNTGANHDYMSYFPAGTYTLSGGISNDIRLYAVCYDDEGNALSNNFNNANGQPRTETISVPFWFRIQIVVQNGIDTSGVKINPQLEAGSTATTYEPYQTPTQYTASLGRTIFGGQPDIVNGVGKETYARIKLDPSWEWVKSGSALNGFFAFIASYIPTIKTNEQFIATGFNYASNVTDYFNNYGKCWCDNAINFNCDPNICGGVTTEAWKQYITDNDIYLVAKLVTPTDFTFTGQEVPTRLGYNAFWSEQGDTEVTYRADIDLLLGGN